MRKKTDALFLDKQLCFSLYSASLAMTQLYKPLLESIGLTYPQYIVMLVLWEQDGIALKEVAEKLEQKPGAIAPVIKRMEAEGFLNRIRSKEDERYIHICLTVKGASLEKEAVNINQCLPDHCCLNIDEMIALKEKLDELKLNIKK